jgi:transcriptional regulator with XRE-family HTH domain
MSYPSANDLQTRVGSNIKKMRHKNGWGQEYAASSIGVSQSFFSKIEKGSVAINFSRLIQIAKMYDVKIVDLVSSEEKTRLSKIAVVEKKIKEREKEIAILKIKLIDLYEIIQSKPRADILNSKTLNSYC